jgi:hypothetical protein
MADVSFHLDRGGNGVGGYVTEGTAQGTSDIELIIDNAVGVTKKDIFLALEEFSKVIKESSSFAEF